MQNQGRHRWAPAQPPVKIVVLRVLVVLPRRFLPGSGLRRIAHKKGFGAYRKKKVARWMLPSAPVLQSLQKRRRLRSCFLPHILQPCRYRTVERGKQRPKRYAPCRTLLVQKSMLPYSAFQKPLCALRSVYGKRAAASHRTEERLPPAPASAFR